MNKKSQTSYICHACGVVFPKWIGRCSSCYEWGSIEEINEDLDSFNQKKIKEKAIEFNILKFNHEIDEETKKIHHQNRIKTSISELDTLLGGGFVNGSVILIGGEPGIGKSTLILQIAKIFSQNNLNSFYISGEESVSQIQIRMCRISSKNEKSSSLSLISSTSLEEILASILNENINLTKKNLQMNLLIIDSIQTISSDRIQSGAGSVAQIKICTNEIVNIAKAYNIITIIVGHVTKDGEIAGPKFLEHMVDTVLYFEGEQNFRILRSVKNRYGASGEIAIFEMNNNGLNEIVNPSMFFLQNFNKNVSGTVIFCGTKGSRPIMSEIQALISQSYIPIPKRACVGFDSNRLSIIIAVLNSRFNIKLFDKEIYINVVGGIKLDDPSADLAVISAILSIYHNSIFPEKTVIFGEIGLCGEIRKVNDVNKRIKESIKLGFKTIIMPKQDFDLEIEAEINIIKIQSVNNLLKIIN